MASQALGAMFGGLEKFLQLRRGLQQDTENREFLKKDRAQQLEFGAGRITGQGLQNEGTVVENKYREPRLQTGLARDQAATFGARGVALKSIFGENADTTGMQEALLRMARREDVQDRGAVAAARGAEGSASLVEDTVAARGEIKANPKLDPSSNREAQTVFDRANLRGGPTFQQTQDAAKLLQDDQQSHAVGMQGNAYAEARRVAAEQIPPGVPPAVHNQALRIIDGLRQTTAMIMQDINVIDRSILVARTNLARLKQTGQTAQNVNLIQEAQDEIDFYVNDKENKLKQIRAERNTAETTMRGHNITDPGTLAGYTALARMATMGAESTPTDVDPKGASRTGTGTIVPGSVPMPVGKN